MNSKKGNILWVDDEIEFLKPHIILLEKSGFEVITATNGDDAVEIIKNNFIDLVFLDENMIGISGLETLPKIKNIKSNLPVIMVTKNEEVELMEEALGSKIDDYLTKPVNPTQILLTCKKFLESKILENNKFNKDYTKIFNEINDSIYDTKTWDDWTELYKKLTQISLRVDELGLKNYELTLESLWKNGNIKFSKFVEENYIDWINAKKGEENPYLSPHINDKFLKPLLDNKEGPVFFIIIDCMRYDQWLKFEQSLYDYFNIEQTFHCAILPTVTAYCRNSIFAGLYPIDIKKHYSDFWKVENAADEHSQNKFEKELLETWLERRRIKVNKFNFFKVYNTEFGQKLEKEFGNYTNYDLVTIVINAVDMIAHSRSDYAILKEIAPNEAAYRSLSDSWFRHSSLFGILKQISSIKNAKVLLTSDHGSVRCLHGVRAYGDRDTSTSLRYKFGKNVKADNKDAMQIENLEKIKLPSNGLSVNNVIAKEDKYLVYPTDFQHYLNKYKDSFQHGGISMEEMIVPVLNLTPKS